MNKKLIITILIIFMSSALVGFVKGQETNRTRKKEWKIEYVYQKGDVGLFGPKPNFISTDNHLKMRLNFLSEQGAHIVTVQRLPISPGNWIIIYYMEGSK